MSASPAPDKGWHIALARSDDFDEWRAAARRLIASGVTPAQVSWSEPGGAGATLFSSPSQAPEMDGAAQSSDADADAAADADGGGLPAPRVSRRFLQLAGEAMLHSDPARFDLAYELLWRIQQVPRLLEDRADPEVRRLEHLARAVRRDRHKMRAFVRFRCVAEADGQERFVAWFEPAHHILRANARFFVDRFAAMRWSILTPAGSLHWDGASLSEGPPAQRSDAPQGDPAEDLWRRYYASIFNPVRLKIGAMLKEMPRKYWKNLPEASLIPGLVAEAQAQEAAMVTKGADLFSGMDRPASLAQVAAGAASCRRCAIGCNGTRAVAGEGPLDASLMIVGEQPGDNEEEQGRPFVGPAGALLDSYLEQVGIDRSASYMTNAVKHFKFEQRGKRRLHQSPTAGEIDTCRWWLDAERALVKPRLILALGASAARGLLGRTVSVQKARGQPIDLADGGQLWITTHPSYLLRLDDAARDEQQQRFAQDLAAVRQRLQQG